MRTFEISRRLVRASWLRRVMAAAIVFGMLAAWAAPAHAGRSRAKAFTILHDSEGETVGVAMFKQLRGDKVQVWVRVWNLPPGFHGFHLHETGICDPPDFTSADGHYNPDDMDHPEHAGDFPTLLVMDDGKGFLKFRTDRFRVREVFDDDGAALIIHAQPDNYANIPERYVDECEEIDQTTLDTGDAGARIACGELQRRWSD